MTKSRKKAGSRFVAGVLLPLLVWSGQALALDCRNCAKIKAVLLEQQDERAQSMELLGKNNAYLEVLSADQASKYLKVKSNIGEILKRLDQIKRKTADAEMLYQQHGCQGCTERVPAGQKEGGS